MIISFSGHRGHAFWKIYSQFICLLRAPSHYSLLLQTLSFSIHLLLVFSLHLFTLFISVLVCPLVLTLPPPVDMPVWSDDSSIISTWPSPHILLAFTVEVISTSLAQTTDFSPDCCSSI